MTTTPLPPPSVTPPPPTPRELYDALIKAIHACNPLSVRNALAKGATLQEEDGRHALLIFVQDHHTMVNGYLEQHGDVRNLSETVREVFRLLTGALQDVDLPCDEQGNSIMHLLAADGEEPLVQMLLDLGFSPRKRNQASETAIDVARREGYSSLAETLAKKKS